LGQLGGSLDSGIDRGQEAGGHIRYLVEGDTGLFAFPHLSTELLPATGPAVQNEDDNTMTGLDPSSIPDPPLVTTMASSSSDQDKEESCEYQKEEAKVTNSDQLGSGEAHSYVCEATFYIQVAAKKNRRPQTTSSLQGHRQRQRRRQLYEQLLRQQLASVEQVWQRTVEPRHEGPAVKRLVETYNKAVTGQFVGLRTYTGGYTFHQLAAHIEAALEDVAAS